MGGRKGRNGLFPATACIKLTGTYGKTIFTVVIKHSCVNNICRESTAV